MALIMQNMSAAIKNVLEAVTIDGQAVFADVAEYPTTDFAGVPAATIVPSDNTSDYATSTQNLRTYAFFVDIYYPVESSNGGYENTFKIMRELMDVALDAFDNSYSTICDFLRPVPSSWAMVETAAGDMLTSRITLQCAKTVDTDNG
jgi:hypothetical protein